MTRRKSHDWRPCIVLKTVHSPGGRSNRSPTTTTSTTTTTTNKQQPNNPEPQPLASDDWLVDQSDLAALESERETGADPLRHTASGAASDGRLGESSGETFVLFTADSRGRLSAGSVGTFWN